MLTDLQYNTADQIRAKAIDEGAWLSFENRMRALMRNVISPVIDLTREDREALFD